MQHGPLLFVLANLSLCAADDDSAKVSLQRFQAIVNGDFIPLHSALVQFDTLTLPGDKAAPQDHNNGIPGTAVQQAKDQIQGAINSRTRGIADPVRGPNNKDRTIDFLWAKLPYHPQYLRRGARVWRTWAISRRLAAWLACA